MEEQKEQKYVYDNALIEQKEKEEKEWHEKYEKKEKDYMDFIEERLVSGTKEARESLLRLFCDKDFVENYKFRNELAYMLVIMQVYESEIKNDEVYTILDMGRSSQEITNKYIDLKFILWRIEFEKDRTGKRLLLDYIHANHATPYMIRQVVNTSTFDKSGMLIKLVDIFLEQNMLRYAFCMLEYLNELSPGNEEILCMLAELCGCTGNSERAGEYLERIENPGIMAERVRKKYGC